MTDYVLTGLVKRRAEMASEIEATHEKLKGLLTALESLDATIVQFDASYKVEAIRPKAFRPPPDWSSHGQMARMTLSILRQATEPMTARDIALEMLVSRALDKDDRKLISLMSKRVGVALRHQRDNGVVTCQPGPGQFVLWAVAR